MKKIICTLLVACLVIGLLAACSGKNMGNTTYPTDNGLVEDVFDSVGDSTQDPTKATVDQNSTSPTRNQQNPGSSQPAQGTTPTQGQQGSGDTQLTKPTAKPTQPAEPTVKPTQPAEPTVKPTQPAEPTVKPTQPAEPTLKPTQPAAPTVKPTQPTEPDQKPTQNTDPTEESTAPTKPTEPTSGLAAEYEAYDAMSSAEKKEFRKTFENTNEFFKWYNAALKAYKEAHPAIPIPPDGNITLNPNT